MRKKVKKTNSLAKKSSARVIKVVLTLLESSKEAIRRLTDKNKKIALKLSPGLREIRQKRVYANVAKRRIALDILERYTAQELEDAERFHKSWQF